MMASLQATATALQSKIAEYAGKLDRLNNSNGLPPVAKVDPTTAEGSNDVGDDEASNPKRVKKRILQKLGKLKRELAQVLESATDITDSNSNKRQKCTNLTPSGDSSLAAAATAVEAVVEEEVVEEDEVTIVTVKPLSKKELKVKLRIVNQELAAFAQKKQLKAAQKRFNWALRKGIPIDVHSYTNLLNAFVRCNEMSGAERLFSEMLQKEQKQQMKVNIIAYTTLLKGYCEVGDMHAARKLYFEQLINSTDESLLPNQRTLNAFLRGCTRTGQLFSALAAYRHAASTDVTADEYVIGLLCRAGQLNSAERCSLASLRKDNNSSSSSSESGEGNFALSRAAIASRLCTTSALFGRFDSSERWLATAETNLRLSAGSQLQQQMQKRFLGEEDALGNRTLKVQSDAATANGAVKESKSLALFNEHLRSEFEQLLAAVQDYIAIRISAESGTESSESVSAAVVTAVVDGDNNQYHRRLLIRRQVDCRVAHLRALSQLLCFGYDSRGDFDDIAVTGVADVTHCTTTSSSSSWLNNDVDLQHLLQRHSKRQNSESSSTATGSQLVFALRDKFGLRTPNVSELVDSNIDSSFGSDIEKQQILQQARQTLHNVTSSAVQKLLRTIDDSSGFINFQHLFAPMDSTSDVSNIATLPIKLEICSGNGDWVTAQATADWHVSNSSRGNRRSSHTSHSVIEQQQRQPKALWLALELRCDRAYNILAQHLLTGGCRDSSSACDNLAILAGDARSIVDSRLAPRSVSAIFINHPQPPERISGSGDSSQGAHLLTVDFFRSLHRILVPATGIITILTDNLAYAQSIAKDVVSMAADMKKTGGDVVGFVCATTASLDDEYTLEDCYSVTAATTVASQQQQQMPTEQRVVRVWRGLPGSAQGHVVPASSYFDRMWQKGQKKRRWFLHLKPI